MQLMDRLRDALELQQFLQYCEELPEWIQEKNIIGQDETCRNAKTVLSKWTRHQAFVAEIASNKNRLHHIQQAGEQLVKEKPELTELINPRIQVFNRLKLFSTSITTFSSYFNVFLWNNAGIEAPIRHFGKDNPREGRTFDANRQVLYEQSCDDIDTWMDDLEKQIVTESTGEDLASVKILMQKQQMIETRMAIKAQQLSELSAQAEYLERMTPEKTEDIKDKKGRVERRFDELDARCRLASANWRRRRKRSDSAAMWRTRSCGSPRRFRWPPPPTKAIRCSTSTS